MQQNFSHGGAVINLGATLILFQEGVYKKNRYLTISGNPLIDEISI